MAAAGPHVWSMLSRVLSILTANLPAALDAIEGDASYPDVATGDLANPLVYQLWTEGSPIPKDFPAVLVVVEGIPDEENFVSAQRTTRIPLAVHVIGRWGDNALVADKLAWCYARAVDDCLQARLPGGAGFLFLSAEGCSVEAWGADGFGRAGIYRGTILQRTQRSAA